MNELIEKISSYHLLTNLLPGVLYVAVARAVLHVDLYQADVFIAAFEYYFIGLVINRIGSLLLEPLLLAARIVRVGAYDDFVRASARDPKIDTLSETNNMYRSICALAVVLACTYLLKNLAPSIAIPRDAWFAIGLLGLFLLFLFSYQKQSRYIRDRVKSNSPL